MEMEDMITEMKKSFEDVRKIKCEECKYKAFAKKLDTFNYSKEILKELRQELVERYEYESKKWTKILMPAVTYIAAPVYATYITNWFHDNFNQNLDFWVGFICISLIFIVLYILFGGIVSAIIYSKDSVRNKHNLLIRFLQRYMREKGINAEMINNEPK